jgi:hypothetical protein
MKLIIEDIRSRDDRTDVIWLGYQSDNEQARKLYASGGCSISHKWLLEHPLFFIYLHSADEENNSG